MGLKSRRLRFALSRILEVNRPWWQAATANGVLAMPSLVWGRRPLVLDPGEGFLLGRHCLERDPENGGLVWVRARDEVLVFRVEQGVDHGEGAELVGMGEA